MQISRISGNLTLFLSHSLNNNPLNIRVHYNSNSCHHVDDPPMTFSSWPEFYDHVYNPKSCKCEVTLVETSDGKPERKLWLVFPTNKFMENMGFSNKFFL